MSADTFSLQPSRIFSRNSNVIAFLAGIDGLKHFGSEAEKIFVEGALTQRKNEFAAGRNIARRCLAEFECGHAVISVLESRAPAWPEGFAGSISHSVDKVGAAVCRKRDYQAIGFDIEKSCAVTAELFDFVLTANDLENKAGTLDPSLATQIFCCKEAVYKAVNPITNEYLDCKDLSIRIDGVFFTATCAPQKASSHLVASGSGCLEVEAGFVRALFLVA